jgi:hypothetical protein
MEKEDEFTKLIRWNFNISKLTNDDNDLKELK